MASRNRSKQSRPRPYRTDSAHPTAAVGARAGKRGASSRKPAVRPATIGDWIGGARLRTLPLSISPVLLGTAAAYLAQYGSFHWVRALVCLIVAVCLQIAVNYANDYSDGIRGTDRYRVGPSRLTGSGAAKPRTVLSVALVFCAIAAVAGAALVIHVGQYWLLAVGAVCILAAYFYTGGRKPYGYHALGEVAAFIFFGIVATAGTTFVQVGTVTIESWLAGAAAGFFAAAVLLVNNIRDREQDRLAGKRTLAVLIGNLPARILFTVLLAMPYLILVFFSIFYRQAPTVYFTLLVAVPTALIALTAKTAGELVLALKLTSLTALLYGLGLAVMIVLI
ncbi:MAG: 1,4-dihydroxy-2-naphthoate polyprenyltransferase [Microbacteriaceae bacterium]